jgi:hypothetical protein
MSGGDGANEHNTRSTRLKFVCKDRGVVNGLAGYFEAVLYDGGEAGKVELSTRPDTIDAKSKDMISWFPIFFPLKVCLVQSVAKSGSNLLRRLLFTFLTIRSWKLAFGGKQMIGRYGTNGSLRRSS